MTKVSELCPPRLEHQKFFAGEHLHKISISKIKKKLQNKNICNICDVLPNRLIHNFSSQVLVSVVDCNESGKMYQNCDY